MAPSVPRQGVNRQAVPTPLRLHVKIELNKRRDHRKRVSKDTIKNVAEQCRMSECSILQIAEELLVEILGPSEINVYHQLKATLGDKRPL